MEQCVGMHNVLEHGIKYFNPAVLMIRRSGFFFWGGGGEGGTPAVGKN